MLMLKNLWEFLRHLNSHDFSPGFFLSLLITAATGVAVWLGSTAWKGLFPQSWRSLLSGELAPSVIGVLLTSTLAGFWFAYRCYADYKRLKREKDEGFQAIGDALAKTTQSLASTSATIIEPKAIDIIVKPAPETQKQPPALKGPSKVASVGSRALVEIANLIRTAAPGRLPGLLKVYEGTPIRTWIRFASFSQSISGPYIISRHENDITFVVDVPKDRIHEFIDLKPDEWIEVDGVIESFSSGLINLKLN